MSDNNLQINVQKIAKNNKKMTVIVSFSFLYRYIKFLVSDCRVVVLNVTLNILNNFSKCPLFKTKTIGSYYWSSVDVLYTSVSVSTNNLLYYKLNPIF